jgi:phosphoribosyl 1,2-cyclic phosphodiesterase
MPSGNFVVRFWGVRGSVPVDAPEFARVGGRTSCVEMRCGEGIFLFDAGSGLQAAGLQFEKEGLKRFDLLLTHCHYDHIMGLPFFKPFFNEDAEVTIRSGHLRRWKATEYIVSNLMKRPFFPVGPSIFKAKVEYEDFMPGDTIKSAGDVRIATHLLNHPGGAVGYRVSHGERSAAYITDMEHVPGEIEPKLIEFIRGADLVIYDAAYTDADFEQHRGFGHSTWQQGIRLCKAAGVERLALFHHSQYRTDEELEDIERAAQTELPGTFLARQDLVITLSP